MSKLGIVIIEGWTEALRWCIQNKPTVVELMLTGLLDGSRLALVKELVQASPKTLLVIRAYPDDYDHPDFQERILKWSEPFRKVSNRVVAHSVNEPVVFNAEDAKRLNNYEVGFVERMSAEGLIPMCFCLSESHLVGPTLEENGTLKNWGNLPLWQHTAPGVKRLAKVGGFLGLNEYDFPNWSSSRDKGLKWRLGHWELNLDWIARFVPQLPRVGIGEGVLDGKIWTSRLPRDDPRYDKPWGYLKVKTGRDYLADIDAICQDSYHDPRVAFHLLFAWAPGHRDWASYDVSVMGTLLSNYLKQNVPEYWIPEKEPMSEELIRAIDVSEYGGHIKEEQWKTAYDAGYRMAIVQAWGGGPVPGGKNAYCAQQLEGARRAGMITAIYFHLPCDSTTRTESLIQAVKEAAGVEYQYIRFVAVDIEGKKLLHPTLWEERLKDAISHIKDKPVIIYTNKNAWGVVMGGVDGFEDYPLWDATYDKSPDLDTNWAPYGGWTHRAMKQYQGTTIVPGGISADLNVAHLGRLSPNQEAEPSELEILQKKYGDLRNAAMAARNTLNGALGDK